MRLKKRITWWESCIIIHARPSLLMLTVRSMGASPATRRVLTCIHCVYTVDVVGVDVTINGCQQCKRRPLLRTFYFLSLVSGQVALFTSVSSLFVDVELCGEANLFFPARPARGSQQKRKESRKKLVTRDKTTLADRR